MWDNGRYYEPPVNPRNLSRMINVTPHHRSAIALKKNLLLGHFVEHKWLSAETFEAYVLDFLVQGNAYMERVANRLGGVYELRHALAQQTRVGLRAGEFIWIDDKWQETPFRIGSVAHLRERDPAQEVYGVPEYLAALQSALLNEAATLFRRRYYINGAHAGFIMYISESGLQDDDADDIQDAVESAKGIGNFKNLFLHIPGGKKDGVQILPISEVAAKDNFTEVKNTTRDDVLAGWRTPPQIMGVVPANAGGFGDVGRASETFFRNEIVPLQKRIASHLNRWAGEDVVRFENPAPVGAGA